MSEQPSVASLVSALTGELLHELVADVAIQEHRLAELRRNRLARSQAAAVAGSSNGLLAPPVVNGGTLSTSPNKKDKDEGLFACLACSRQIAAPRYASHLSGCMGLTGSRRGGERRAAANGRAVNGISRSSPAASSYGSDTDNERKASTNGSKRAATSSPAINGTKKAKPAPLAPGSSTQFQPPHMGSHPLSKTMSLPASPSSPHPPSPAQPAPLQPPPRPASTAPRPSSSAMQAGKSVPSKMPASRASHPHPLATASLPSKTPARPAPPAPPKPAPIPSTAHPQPQSDRPDSESEASDSDTDAPAPKSQGAVPQKTPRVPPPPGAGPGGVPPLQAARASAAAGGAGAQKQPRKAMPVGRKAARPIAGVAADPDSSDDDASDGSGSD
ncbi:hypothetical protein JCM1841_001139 [Sporobolomyces salmonicolor]